jgi:hypothetical protein
MYQCIIGNLKGYYSNYSATSTASDWLSPHITSESALTNALTTHYIDNPIALTSALYVLLQDLAVALTVTLSPLL